MIFRCIIASPPFDTTCYIERDYDYRMSRSLSQGDEHLIRPAISKGITTMKFRTPYDDYYNNLIRPAISKGITTDPRH